MENDYWQKSAKELDRLIEALGIEKDEKAVDALIAYPWPEAGEQKKKLIKYQQIHKDSSKTFASISATWQEEFMQ